MGTVGGNLCLDTRCIFYNQSEWWRSANNHCLKTTGEICHVAPKSRGVCFATFSGDLAPALMTLDAEVDIAHPKGKRTLPLKDLYIGHARHDGSGEGDGKHYLALQPGEFVTAVRAKNAPGLRSAYDKIRIRRSIEYPVAGVAVALRRDGDTLADLRVAITGTNPRPVLLEGTRELCGGALDERVFKGLDDLVRDQIMSMKTTFTPGHYRRRVAGVLARRLVQRLFAVRRPYWLVGQVADPRLSCRRTAAHREAVVRQLTAEVARRLQLAECDGSLRVRKPHRCQSSAARPMHTFGRAIAPGTRYIIRARPYQSRLFNARCDDNVVRPQPPPSGEKAVEPGVHLGRRGRCGRRCAPGAARAPFICRRVLLLPVQRCTCA